MSRHSRAQLLVAGAALTAALSTACTGSSSGVSSDEAKSLVALSLAGNTELQLATFTGTFCEGDDGRRMRSANADPTTLPSNAYAFGKVADSRLMKTLIAGGYVEVKEQTLAPDAAEAVHPACGKRATCDGCPVTSQYFVSSYQLTPKGKDLFLVTPVTENEFTTLYNSGPLLGPFDDVEQEFGDDMPMRISLVIATKAFDVTSVATDPIKKTGQVEYEWYWKPAPRIEKTALQQLVPQGRKRATVALKQLDDGWHLERDAAPATE